MKKISEQPISLKSRIIVFLFALYAAVSLFFPLVIKEGTESEVISFFELGTQHASAYLVVAFFIVSMILVLSPKRWQHIIAGALSFVGWVAMFYMILGWTNDGANLPDKYLVNMLGVILAPPVVWVRAIIFFQSAPIIEPDLASVPMAFPIENDHISAFKVYQAFKKLIEKADKPFDAHELVVQEDAFSRLEDEHNDGLSFARYVYDRVEKDGNFPLALLLFKDRFVLDLGGVYVHEQLYSYFKDEETIAEQLFLALELCLNGQIAFLASNQSGKLYAIEMLLFKKDRTMPVVFSTTAQFPWFKDRGEETEVLKNNVIDAFFPVPDNFFLYRALPDGRFPYLGRPIESLEDITPLSKNEWALIQSELQWLGTGKKVGQNPTKVFISQWEFWAINLVVYGGTLLALFLGLFPDYIKDNLGYIAVWPEIFIVGWLMPIIIRNKYNKAAQSQKED